MQHELKEGNLLDEKGDLVEAGYAYKLIKKYKRTSVKASKMRLKEWDYYFVGDDEYGLAFTIADNGYMSLVSISLLEFKEKREVTKSILGFMPLGKLKLPETSEDGDLIYDHKKLHFEFKNNKKVRHLSIMFKNLKKNIDFKAEIDLEEKNPNSMVIATPFNKKKHFYYNQKVNCLKATGWFMLNEEKHILSPKTYGVLDWGRGVWTYSNTWYWSSLNSIDSQGHTLGFNLGYGFGDTKNASENMFFFDDKAFKLEDVTFDIPKDNKKDDFMKEWKVYSKDKNINLKFSPVLDRHADSNVLIIRSNQHQVFGYFDGTISVENKVYNIDHLFGFAEKVKNRW